MWKEFRTTIIIGFGIFVLFANRLNGWVWKDSIQLLNVILWVYIGMIILTIGELIYKKILNPQKTN